MTRKNCMRVFAVAAIVAGTVSLAPHCNADPASPSSSGTTNTDASAAPAAAATAATPAVPATTTTPADAAATGKPIQAGVQMIEVNLETLRDLGLDLKNILKASSSLYDEVTIQPVTVQTEPEVVGRGIVINIPIGFTPTGAGPQPKKARVEAAMSQMQPLIELMKKDTDDFENGRKQLDVSDKVREDLKPMLDQWAQLVNDVNSKFQSLQTLCKQRPYDCNSIGTAATDIHNTTKKMDEVRRKVYKLLQKDGALKKNA